MQAAVYNGTGQCLTPNGWINPAYVLRARQQKAALVVARLAQASAWAATRAWIAAFCCLAGTLKIA